MQVYRTKEGDVLDAVVYAAYGQCTDAMLRTVLSANPGLADRGPILPSGVMINLPDSVSESDNSGLANQGVALWD